MKFLIQIKLLILFLFVSLFCNAQFETNYSPLKSSGFLPEEFLKSARLLSQEELKTVPYGKDHDNKQQFIIYQNYFLQNMLVNGDVLVNDKLTSYVNKVADELLKDNKELRTKLHIFVIKNPDVNAHAFDKGFIFINMGLLAQLENEAQLAYILSHEITHVVKKHSITEYIENIKLENGTSDYEDGDDEERNLAKYRFSKEQETEADVDGLNMLKQSAYSIKSVSGAFDVLQYSYLPFELIDFKKSFFEDNYLILPDTLNLKKTSEVKSNDDYDDTKSSHPNIRKRRGTIEPDLKVSDEANRKKFLVSEEKFKEARETARFELCHQYMIDRDYVNAIYACYILLQKYPENIYLKKTITTALYNISVNKSSSNSSHYISSGSSLTSKTYSIPDYQKIEGASQRLYYLLDNLTAPELNVVALNYAYKAHKKFPTDASLSNLTDSLLSELVYANNLYINDFSKKSKEEIKKGDVEKPIIKDNTTEEEESKYSKIKKQQQEVEVKTEDNFIKYALVGNLKDDDFVRRYTTIAKGLTKKSDYVSDEDLNKKKKEKKSKKKKVKEDDKLFGIEKVIFTDPYYVRAKFQKFDEVINYYESEDQQKVLLDIQKKCADKLKLAYSVVSAKSLTPDDMEKYNENALINEWISERFKHGDNNDELVTNAENVKQLIEKLGTKYICWSGIYNVKGHSYKNTYFFLLFDLQSGKVMKYETRSTHAKDRNDMITSFVYNSLMHVAKKEK